MKIESAPTYRSYSSAEDLESVYSELVGNVRLQYIVSSIRIHLCGFIPEVSMRLYSYESQEVKYWICLKIFPENWSQVFVGCVDEVNMEEFQKFFTEVLKYSDGMKEILRLGALVFGEKELSQKTEQLLHGAGLISNGRNTAFYVVCGKSKEEPVHKLPQGYVIDFIHEEDVELVAKMWAYGKKNEEYYVRKRISRLPSVCIRYPEGTVDGKSTVAGWALCEHSGMIIHLFVMREHRRNGLQKVIMSELAHQIHKRIGITAFYGTSTENDSMIRCIEKDDLVRDNNGQPIIVSFGHTESVNRKG